MEVGEDRSQRGQKPPKEEDWGSRRPALDQDALKADWQTAADHAGQEVAWSQANAGPKATGLPYYPQDSRPPRKAQLPGGRTERPKARPGDTSTPPD